MSQRIIRENIYTIAPHAPFLDCLVENILNGPLLADWPRSNPFWLADVTIILPTQRSRLALSSAFAKALGGGATLPDIRTLDGDEGDAKYFDVSDSPNLPKAIGVIERQFHLGNLIEAWIEKQIKNGDLAAANLRANPARVLSLAASLGDLIDEIEIEGIAPNSLRAAPPTGLNPSLKSDLSENFQNNLHFLEIALSYWPQRLAELNLVDASRLRNMRIVRHINQLSEQYGDRPVIVAGSTGSVPSTARLLKAIAGLPKGAIVLPGFNKNLSGQNHLDLAEISNAPHGHPQYGLSHLLPVLGVLPTQVTELAPKPTHQRGQILHHALALAKDTANWQRQRAHYSTKDILAGTKNVGVIVGKNEREQALAIALAARDALANGKSVGIISPDRNFGRRVSVDLKRFGIVVDDSAGTPLYHSPTGRLIRQILTTALSQFSAVDLMSLLRDQYISFGQEQIQFAKTADLLEFALLRGQRVSPGLDALKRVLDDNLAKKLDHPIVSLSPDEGQEIALLIKNLNSAFAPLFTLLESNNFSARDLAQSLGTVLHALVPSIKSNDDILPGATPLREWIDELLRTKQRGPTLKASDAQAVLPGLMDGYSVRAQVQAQDNISIWGRLEARMQKADLIILCSLNEGIWPEVADPGPWLSRGMRLNAGLQPPERQQGLAAHDFEMAMGHPNVLLSYSERVGTSPALPSRLVERLFGFIGRQNCPPMRTRGDHWVNLARRMDKTKEQIPAARPVPNPVAGLRPRSLSVTEVETLIRSPFDLYAKYVLNLKPINPLGEDLSARERGTLIHEVFARFVQRDLDPTAADAHNTMMDIAQEVFAQLETMPERRDIWLRRFAKSAHGFLEFERTRQDTITKRYAEQKLLWAFPIDGTKFTLRGAADRIDLRHDGKVEILDFKTGGIPDPKQMRNFMAPQLLVEAAMVKASGYENQKSASTHTVSYIKIGADPVAFTPTDFSLPTGSDIDESIDQMMRNLYGRIDAFLLSDRLAMAARIMPNTNQSYAGPYDHLARTSEWSELDMGDED